MKNRQESPIRVVMLAHTYYLIDARVQREAECLANAGYETHVVCAWQPPQADGKEEPRYQLVNRVHVHHVRLSRKRGKVGRYIYEYFAMTLLGMWALVWLNLKYRFDIIHIHNMPDFLVLAALPLKWLGATLVLDVHDPMNEMFRANYELAESHPLSKLIRWQERVCYRMAHRLLTVSTAMAENIARKAGCSVTEVAVVRNLPDSRKFPIRVDDRGAWPFHEKEIRILYCGTVTEHYNLGIAVEALAILANSIPKLRLQILGNGNCIEQVLRLAHARGVGDKVEHTLHVSQSRVVEIMANADIGISTHRAGVFGDLYFSTKIIEFMTQGLPVISSRTYTIEQLVPESSIFYFEPGNARDLANKITFMFNNPQLVIDKIANSKELVRKYNWDVEQQSLLSFYQSLLKS